MCVIENPARECEYYDNGKNDYDRREALFAGTSFDWLFPHALMIGFLRWVSKTTGVDV